MLNRRSILALFSTAALAAALPAEANLRLHGQTVSASTFAPGNAWNGTLTDATPPIPATRTTAMPWCNELFQNWDTLTGTVTLGFQAGAGGLTAKDCAYVQFYCHGATANVSAPTWVTWTDPNGTAHQEYGYYVTMNAASIYARGVGLGQAKPQFALWAIAYPNDPTMQTQTIGPFTLNPRSTRFDGTITLAPSGANAASFSQVCTQKASNNYERVNVVCTTQGAVTLDSASGGGILTDITTTGIVGITITAAQTAAFSGSIATQASTVTASFSGNQMTVTGVTGSPLAPGATLSDTLAHNPTFPKGMRILSQSSGSAGGNGVYVVNWNGLNMASSTFSSALCVLTVSAVTSGALAAGNTLVSPDVLPNVVIQPFATGGTTGAGGTGTYVLTAFGPNDALPEAGYTLSSRNMTTTVTVTMGDGTVSTWNPNFDGVRFEGAGIKFDIPQVGNAIKSAFNFTSNSYGAYIFAGCDVFAGVPTSTAGATGSGAGILLNGIVPNPVWMKISTNQKSSGTLVPGGVTESVFTWMTFFAAYVHDTYSAQTEARGSKHCTFARVPQPAFNIARWAQGGVCYDSSAVAAGLRTYVNSLTPSYAGTGTSPTFFTSNQSGGNTNKGGPITITVSSSNGSFSINFATTNTFTDLANWLNDTGAGKPGSDGWSSSAVQDTTGRSVVYISLPGLAPSVFPGWTGAAQTPIAVPGGGLQLSSIIDVHSDVIALTKPTPLYLLSNRSFYFFRAFGTVEAAPLLLSGAGSTAQDIGIVNCLFQDVTDKVVGVGNQTPTSIGGPANHVVWRRNTCVDVNGAFSVASLFNPDAYTEFNQNYFENMPYSASVRYTSASFDGTNVMTVNSVSGGSSFTATISGTTMTISAIASGTPAANTIIQGPGVLPGTAITAIGAGGTTGPYTVSLSQTVASPTGMVSSAAVIPGDVIQTTNVIVRPYGSGGTTGIGGPGTYQLNTTAANSGAASRTINGNANLVPSRNCYRTGTSPYGSDALCKNFAGGQTDATLFNLVTPNDYSPISAGQLRLTDLTYAGALLPDGSWNLAA